MKEKMNWDEDNKKHRGRRKERQKRCSTGDTMRNSTMRGGGRLDHNLYRIITDGNRRGSYRNQQIAIGAVRQVKQMSICFDVLRPPPPLCSCVLPGHPPPKYKPNLYPLAKFSQWLSWMTTCCSISFDAVPSYKLNNVWVRPNCIRRV